MAKKKYVVHITYSKTEPFDVGACNTPEEAASIAEQEFEADFDFRDADIISVDPAVEEDD